MRMDDVLASRGSTRLVTLSDTQRAGAVASFDAVYGEMERALWCLSQNCRSPLIEGHSAPVVEELVWTVKSWWGVQGVRLEAKAQMAGALASLRWSEELFHPVSEISADAAQEACEHVE